MAEQTDTRTVTTVEELNDALAEGVRDIVVSGTVSGTTRIAVPAGGTLRGAPEGGRIESNAVAVRLGRDATVEDLEIVVPEHEVAVTAARDVDDWGTLTLRRITTDGQISLVAEDRVKAGHVHLEDVTVRRADLRGRSERPHGFGVDVLQGAVTVWNRQVDPDSLITVAVDGLTLGSEEAPVRGSGLFLSGHGDDEGAGDGGRLTAERVVTGEIHTDGGIPEDTPHLISGGVFVLYGAEVAEVVNAGPVTTYGQNDMVLDNWGTVRTWTAQAPITSRGPSGIGFVNFADIDLLDVQAPVTTHGSGARAFNVYAGTLREARFDSLVTHGDGAIGLQVSKPVGRIEVRGDVATEGGEALSLVKGVQMKLKALAISVKEGGEVEELRIGGSVRTRGEGVNAIEVDGVVHTASVGDVESVGEGGRRVVVGETGECPEGLRRFED